MSPYSNSRSHQRLTVMSAPDASTVALASLAAFLFTAVILASSMRQPLVFPALALVSTVYAMIMGGIGYTRTDRIAETARISAGVFAFAAVAACIVGSPDQVALLFQR